MVSKIRNLINSLANNIPKKERYAIFLLIMLFLLFVITATLYIDSLSKKFDIQPEIIDTLSKEDLKLLLEINKQNESYNIFGFIAISILSFIIGFALCFYFFEKRAEFVVDDALFLLSGKEKEFFRQLLINKGQAYQFHLRKELNLNKVDMTRLVEKLEKKGLIIVDRSTRMNLIRLSDNVIDRCKKLGII